ncbi:aldolase catalytic domain-containing protein [uncultured Winogradskyella sp.]|uniref:aldolase catalytic domain-containing protein n=1 Tax=uncultured Winogradskyella sp. TaxID=395353 RepID=UPI00261A4FED|nr:aldolase catalytic domain-containing protein [uncultured Winogradskyella sp.]
MEKKFKTLDCTLRDGGYYTNWDFNKDLVHDYCRAIEVLPIEYVEIGYRSIPLNGYLGEYFYCPEHVMAELKALMPSKKLAIILNEKDIRGHHVEDLLKPCLKYIAMVRIAIDPKNFKRAIELAKAVKLMGFEVAFNVMYMSNWKQDSDFLNDLEGLEDTIDYFYMVDSFGGIMPNDVVDIMTLVKSKTNVKLGFHGHNNLEMALINTITSINEGCEIVDCTITGMGRGAGNLKTELFLTYLNKAKNIEIEYTKLGKVVASFEDMKKKHGWGTNLPYMFSGAFSLPQKQVMEWVGMNRYPMSSVVNALKNQKEDIEDNFKLPILEKEERFYKTTIILGGGKSARNHNTAIKKLIKKEKSVCLIHAGARNVSDYLDVKCDQFYALSGFESEKLLSNINDHTKLSQTCIYPPFPRVMGTVIPKEIKSISKELSSISFTKSSTESPLTIAIQIGLDLGVHNVYLVGFDGYDALINQTQQILAQENQAIINDLLLIKNLNVLALTPTKYKNLSTSSIHSLI